MVRRTETSQDHVPTASRRFADRCFCFVQGMRTIPRGVCLVHTTIPVEQIQKMSSFHLTDFHYAGKESRAICWLLMPICIMRLHTSLIFFLSTAVFISITKSTMCFPCHDANVASLNCLSSCFWVPAADPFCSMCSRFLFYWLSRFQQINYDL